MLRRLWLWLRGETPNAIFSFEGYGTHGEWAKCLVCKRIVSQHALLIHARREHEYRGEHVLIN